MNQTLTEKILSRATGKKVLAGEIVYPEPDLITVHDWYVTNFDMALKGMGVNKLYAPEKVLISTDHEPLAVSLKAVERQKAVREIVKKYSIKNFFDAGRGGQGHVFPIEYGMIYPGMFIEAYDVHATNYGAMGALAIPLVIEISEVLACGSVWLKVPETVLIKLEGKFQNGTTVRDLAQKLISDLGSDIVDYSVVEFAGEGLQNLCIEERQILCNTPIDIGAKSTIVEPDNITFEYLKHRVSEKILEIKSDKEAKFKYTARYFLNDIEPQVAVPPTPDCVMNISKVSGIKINHAFIGSCAAPGINDLELAANIIKGKKIHKNVRLFITPATQNVMKEAESKGYLSIFANAGAIITQPGCGPCAAGKIGGLASGETSINTGTRNDYGRLGASDAKIFLGSAATVAASAINGEITDPRKIK